MRILVTGGAGFIGSTLVDRLLSDGHSVDVLDDLSSGKSANLVHAREHRAFRFEQLDIRDPNLEACISASEPEVIFHLAAQASVSMSLADPVHDAEVNILGSLRVLDAARHSGVRKVVFAASGGTLYGDVDAERLPVGENVPHAPSAPYGIAKAVVLEYLDEYRQHFGLDFTALALANVYGPRQDPFGEAGVVAIFATNFATDRTSTITGTGQQTRDFVYVEDVADAFARAATAASGMVLNIGTGRQTSVNEIHRLLAVAADADDQANYAPARPGEVFHSALDPRLAGRHLGWFPRTNLADGLVATLEAARSAMVALPGTTQG